jgi:outer membrane protein assembly factor BamA
MSYAFRCGWTIYASALATALVGSFWLPLAACAQGEDVAEQDSTSTPGNTLVPLPVLFYMPETGVGFGGLATYYFRTSGGGVEERPSSVTPILVYTAKKQVIAQLEGEVYLSRERYRLDLEAAYSLFPTKFWGVGNQAPEAAEEDYTPRTVNLAVTLQRRAGHGWYVGGTVRVGYRALVEVEEDGLLDRASLRGTNDGRVVGLGLRVTRDTRDNLVYPRSGSFHQFGGSWYSSDLGSSYDYGSFSLDLRKYLSVVGTHVVAFRGLAMASVSQPPFDLMPQLGGDVLLRGYFGGRYRDRQLLAFQGEYRTPIWWRVGLVGFAGAGQVADSWRELALGEFHGNAGVGVRFQLSRTEGLNIRADYGWGFDAGTTGFYLSVGEAF